MRDYNSTDNQHIKGKFIGREAIKCESYLVSGLLEKGIYNWEDVENMYVDADKCYKDYGYESAEEMRDDGADMQEIFEWWTVSDFLLKKLEEKGEPILRTDHGDYWGRTCTGQAILLDGVISDICYDMQILKGQKYSWLEAVK